MSTKIGKRIPLELVGVSVFAFFLDNHTVEGDFIDGDGELSRPAALHAMLLAVAQMLRASASSDDKDTVVKGVFDSVVRLDSALKVRNLEKAPCTPPTTH